MEILDYQEHDIFTNDAGHSRIVTELEACNIYKKPKLGFCDPSLYSQQFFQPPGFYHVDLGRVESFFPNFVL